jgi:hypothetical protein
MTPNKQQLLKDFVTSQLQSAKQQIQPIINPNGFKNGEPPAGSNWRIPGDTLYNPTPYPIQAVSDNGIAKTLNPFDESNVEFPGAQYVDEYQMRNGGLNKFNEGGSPCGPGLIYDFRKGSCVTEANFRDSYSGGDKFDVNAEKAIASNKDYIDDVNFTQKWINSPMYKTMLKNSTSSEKGYNKIYEGRNNQLASTPPLNFLGWMDAPEGSFDPEHPTLGFSDNATGQITELPHTADLNYFDTFRVHELSHSSDRPLENEKNRLIPTRDNIAIKLLKKGPLFSFGNSYNKYLNRPTETRARLNQIRKIAVDNNLYDPFTEKVTPEILEKIIERGDNATKKTKYSNEINELQKIYSNRTIRWMLNHISENKSDNDKMDIQLAKIGGLAKFLPGGPTTNCPPGSVPDENGNCVFDLSTPPTPESSLFDYYTDLLNKPGMTPEIARKAIKAKRTCKPGDECWEEVPPTPEVEIPIENNPFDGMERLYIDLTQADYDKVPSNLKEGTHGGMYIRNRVPYGWRSKDGTVYYERGVPGTPGYQGKFSGKVDLSKYHFVEELNPKKQDSDLVTRKNGGLAKFLPKAQGGLETTPEFTIPADAGRYGVDKPINENPVTVDPELIKRREFTQKTINEQSTFKNPRSEFEKKLLNSINRLDGFDVSEAGYLPENLKTGSEYYCISGVCYTLNDAGEPIRYYSNSLAQDDVAAGKVPNWKLNYDLGSIKGGDILQFTGNRSIPHHAGLVVPNSIVKNNDGTLDVNLFMNNGNGHMYQETYNINPKTDMAGNGETTQLLTRDFGDTMSQAVNTRDWLDKEILKQDPQFFTRKKGAQSRWQTYSPGMFTEKGKTWISMDGEPLGVSTPTMMQNTDPDIQAAGELLKQRTLTVPKTNLSYTFDALNDVDYNALSKTAGFNQILNKVNDENFKLDFMKKFNISNREYNGIVSNTFGIYGQESGFGTKPGGFSETDTARSMDSVYEDLKSRFSGKGRFKKDKNEDYSRGLTQVKLRNIDKDLREKYGITTQSIESNPESAFLAAMITNAQNLPQLRKLARKGETKAIDESNYLDFMPYLYSMPGRLRRGDKNTIIQAIDNGKNPEEAIVRDPNSPDANNEYIKNVRTFANMFQHYPTTGAMDVKEFGGLTKYQKAGLTFEELMMQGMRPQMAASDATYVANPRIEEARRDDAKGVTPAKKVQAATAKKKMVAEEKRQELANQLANQGTISADTQSDFDKNVQRTYYAVSNPMSALGNYVKYGYIPQGNVGNYGQRFDQSPMEMIANSVNPFAWANAGLRFTNDLADKNTYTSGYGALNATLDLIEAAPMLGVMKSGLPSVAQDINLGKRMMRNTADQGLTFLENNKGVFGRQSKMQNISLDQTTTPEEFARLKEIENGMAISTMNKNPNRNANLTNFLQTTKLSDEELAPILQGKTKAETIAKLQDESTAQNVSLPPSNELPPPPGTINLDTETVRRGINLERPTRPGRSQAQRDADSLRRSRRAVNDYIRNNNLTQEQVSNILDEIPAFQRRNINIDTSTDGLPRIDLFDIQNTDFDPRAFAESFSEVLQRKPVTFNRTRDAVKGLFTYGKVEKPNQQFTTSYYAHDYHTPREMYLDVKGKLDAGLKSMNIGEVGTGATNTSHNSFLTQMDFIAKNAGKQGLSKPVFLGYREMNPSGYLSQAGIPNEQILKYINTNLNKIQSKTGTNFNLGTIPPYIENGKIMLPQYGVKKLGEGFQAIKKEEGGSVLSNFVMSQLQNNR